MCGGITPTVKSGDGGGVTPSAEASAYKTPGGRAIPQCVQWWCISVSCSWQLGQWMWMAIYTSQATCYAELRHSIAHPLHRNACHFMVSRAKRASVPCEGLLSTAFPGTRHC